MKEKLHKLGCFSLFLILLLMLCQCRHDARVSTAFALAENQKPDRALALLKSINAVKLTDKDRAMYSLVYYIAQDKSGLDVDNDSLIRIAYDWYRDKPADTLYSRCQYYMGIYYALNDSTEKALHCFFQSFKSAKVQKDNYIQSLALSQASVILRTYNPDFAIRCARLSYSLYNRVKGATITNRVYSLLNLAECLYYKEGNMHKSIIIVKNAVKLALKARDSVTIANAYQDLSAFYSASEHQDSALVAAKLSHTYNPKYDASSTLALAQAYYYADSLVQAKRTILKIPPKDYLQRGDDIFCLLRMIAMKDGNYTAASAYSDSTELYLRKANTSNIEAKNGYYSLLLQKEVLRAKAQSESQWKTWLITMMIVLVVVIASFFLYVFKQRKIRLEEHFKETEYRQNLEIKHKETQIETMRNFLMRKIDIINTIENIKSNEYKQIILKKDDWEEMEIFLNNTDDEFVTRLQRTFPDLTQKDIHFLMLLRLKLPYTCLATIYHIEEKSIKQKLFLFKAKLGLKGSEISTHEFIEKF